TLEKLDDAPTRSGQAVRSLLKEPRRLLATLLLGNEIVNIGLSSVMAAIVFTLAGQLGSGAADLWWLNIVFATPLLLVFGEVAPKAVAVRTGIRWARAVAVPLTLFATAFAPLRLMLEAAARLVLHVIVRISGGRLDRLLTDNDSLAEALEEAQFRALVRMGAKDGALDPKEAALIHRVFDLTDTPVSKLMTARAEVSALSLNATDAEIVSTARTSGYSRLPVYAGDLDNIRGILLLKDLLQFRARGEEISARGIEKLLQDPYFVPPGKTAGELLREFQSKRAHIALVLDEYGTLQGVITMQDVLGTLFEPIRRSEGEHPSESEQAVERLAEGIFRVPARMTIEEFNAAVGPALPAGDTYTTVAGYIFHLFGKLPAKGDQVADKHWSFHVSGLEGTRLTRVTATRRDRREGARARARDLGINVATTAATEPVGSKEDEA
ncbi:MAG: HlyC/CorC family transporter, partial [Deltaproteobacteria bacterium]|nr:HlyC/CorC family transporter [Deltaproteobacteria bacterium]